jgi:hypothetical protein
MPSLYFEYMSNSSLEGLTGAPILHLASTSLAISTLYRLSIWREDESGGRLERDLIFDGSRSQGCAFTVGSVGNYSIFFNSISPRLSGQLLHDGLFSFFAAGGWDNLYSAVPFYSPEGSAPRSTIPRTVTSSETPPLTSNQTMTPTSSGSITPIPSHRVTPRSSEDMSRTPSEDSTPTANQRPTSAGSPGSEGSGSKAAVIVVPIVVVVVAISMAVVLWWFLRHRDLSDEAYQSVTESFLDVRID